MGSSIDTSGESLPIPNQTNKSHVCAFLELCVKPCREVSLLDHLVSRYCPCYDRAVSDLIPTNLALDHRSARPETSVVRPYLIWTGGGYSQRGANSWRGDTSTDYPYRGQEFGN